MITPNDIYITEEEFKTLVNDAEKAFIEERNNQPIEERDSFVRFWVKLRQDLVPNEYIDRLDRSYRDCGWNRVRIEFINDRTESLMVYLNMK